MRLAADYAVNALQSQPEVALQTSKSSFVQQPVPVKWGWCCWLSSVSPSTLLLAGSCHRTRQTGSHHLQGSKCRCLISSGHFGRVPYSWVVGELQEARKGKGVPVWLGLTYIQLARWQQVGNLPVYLVVCLLRLWPASCRQCTHPAGSCTASW